MKGAYFAEAASEEASSAVVAAHTPPPPTTTRCRGREGGRLRHWWWPIAPTLFLLAWDGALEEVAFHGPLIPIPLSVPGLDRMLPSTHFPGPGIIARACTPSFSQPSQGQAKSAGQEERPLGSWAPLQHSTRTEDSPFLQR